MNNFVEIFIPDSNGKSTLIDFNDWDLFRSKDWYISGHTRGRLGYLMSSGKYFHKCIFNDKYKRDHVNRNTLDNRRSNLRKCTNSENQANKEKSKNNTTGYKGISYRSDSNCYYYQMRKDGVNYKKSGFKTAEEAALAYNKIAIYLYGEFAYLNKIKEV